MITCLSIPIRKTLAFAGGFLVAALLWMALRPVPRQSPPPPAKNTAAERNPRTQLWDSGAVNEALSAVSTATTNEAKLKASAHLSEIPLEQVQEALELATSSNDSQVSLAAKVLLIRWAGDDGEAATGWAWRRFDKTMVWEEAFRSIGPAWAWHDSRAFGTWALEVARKAEHDYGPKEDPGGQPVLSQDLYSRMSDWLVREQPKMAYQLMFKSSLYSTRDSEVARALETTEQIKQALEAFNLDPADKATWRNLRLGSVLARFNEIDPVEFNRSPYRDLLPDHSIDVSGLESLKHWDECPPQARAAQADAALQGLTPDARGQVIWEILSRWAPADPEASGVWLAALPERDRNIAERAYVQGCSTGNIGAVMSYIETLPPERSLMAIVVSFDAWNNAHPASLPDQSDWSEGQRQAWSDLEALGDCTRPDF